MTMYPRTEMLDVVVVDGRARGIVTRNLLTGKIESHAADAVLSRLAATAIVFISPLTPKDPTRPPFGAPISVAPRLGIHVTPRFIPRVSP